ncbi:esterase FE4-like [Spodoptera litura]|uniref:Carboxylic ester hydrolase n=1 Tax=Spodoptera litura TaxID=69820 RepID=A0A9J7DWE5_SPOLT|nr:esterase FE4-like [Spodoptera litura]
MLKNVDMLSVLLLVSICSVVLGQYRLDPLVSTNRGLIRGLLSSEGYAKFLGIPYAEVDKNNPFGPSVPHPGFDGIFEAYESNACPQVTFSSPIGTIDCLTLNVYVPSTATSQHRLPVMVWIHGGYFILGSGDSVGSPEFLLKHEVIIVTINFRLGVFGFMCLDHPEISGNQGLKDQVLALRWINENIEAFGGDPTQITVFGESSGGMSINLHLLSSYEPLFQKAIIQSGPAVSPWVLGEPDNTVPIRLARGLGFFTEDISEALIFLSSVNPHKLVELAHGLKLTNFMTLESTPVTIPCVEKNIEGVEHFITEYPMNIRSTKLRTVQVIFGNSANEMHMGYANDEVEGFLDYSLNVVRTIFDLGDNLEEVLDDIKHFYIGDDKAGESTKVEITNFASDIFFNHPTEKMADRLLEIGARTVYRYIFSYSGDRNVITLRLNVNATGAVRADELGYLFDSDELTDDITPDDQIMIDRITTLWTNFAKYGNPTPATSELLPIKWEPITRTTQPYLNLDSDLTLEARPFHDRMAFWDIFRKLHRNQHRWNQISGM